MPKRTKLASALHEVSGKSSARGRKQEEVQQLEVSTLKASPLLRGASRASSKRSKPELPPSRQGKKAIAGHFDPAVSKQLKQLALEEDTTVQALLAEALNDLFEKYDKKAIA